MACIYVNTLSIPICDSSPSFIVDYSRILPTLHPHRSLTRLTVPELTPKEEEELINKLKGVEIPKTDDDEADGTWWRTHTIIYIRVHTNILILSLMNALTLATHHLLLSPSLSHR